MEYLAFVMHIVPNIAAMIRIDDCPACSKGSFGFATRVPIRNKKLSGAKVEESDKMTNDDSNQNPYKFQKRNSFRSAAVL